MRKHNGSRLAVSKGAFSTLLQMLWALWSVAEVSIGISTVTTLMRQVGRWKGGRVCADGIHKSVEGMFMGIALCRDGWHGNDGGGDGVFAANRNRFMSWITHFHDGTGFNASGNTGVGRTHNGKEERRLL